MTYVSNGWRLFDQCPRCRASDYVPLPDLMALCHECGAEYRRRWVRQDDIDQAVTRALREAHAKRGAA